MKKCQWESVKEGPIKGYKVCGPNGNSIFLPYTGIRYEKIVSNKESAGYYWTSEMAEGDRTNAYFFYFDEEMPNDSVNNRNFVYSGRAIRPICKK